MGPEQEPYNPNCLIAFSIGPDLYFSILLLQLASVSWKYLLPSGDPIGQERRKYIAESQ